MKTINGFTYSKEPFEGWKFRAKFRFSVDEDWRNNISVDIYTTCSDKLDVYYSIMNNISDKVIEMTLEHFTTKEQDELTAKFIEETLKDL